VKYFIAPRSGEKSYKNFQSTIKNGVPLSRLSPFLNDVEKAILASEEIIYAWGNREGTKSAWNDMAIGDTVIFCAKGILVMTGEVYMKKHSPELALSMWPPDDKGKPWEYTFFLKNIRYISVPMKVFNSAAEYKQNFIIQGFIQLKSERIANITKHYGSVDSLLHLFEDPNSEESPTTNDKLYINVPEEVHPIVINRPDLEPKILIDKKLKVRSKKKIDYVLRNKNNAILGSKGEELVLKYEKDYLEKEGYLDLAKRVTRVSLDDDTLGYDILSFEIDGRDKLIEVKTSGLVNNVSIRFYVTTNEYNVGKDRSDYFIYYIESVNSLQPHITIIEEPMDKSKFLIQPDGYIFEAARK
jgi:hypothetical protein